MEIKALSIRTLSVLVLTAIFVLPAVAGKPAPTVQCTVNGEVVTSVAYHQQYAVSGTGYKKNGTVSVCINNTSCIPANVDGDGKFYQVRTAYQPPGTHELVVKQARNSHLDHWTVKAVMTLTVTD